MSYGDRFFLTKAESLWEDLQQYQIVESDIAIGKLQGSTFQPTCGGGKYPHSVSILRSDQWIRRICRGSILEAYGGYTGSTNDAILVLIVAAKYNREPVGFGEHRNYVRSISTLVRVQSTKCLITGCSYRASFIFHILFCS
jgi:hypothetical protein